MTDIKIFPIFNQSAPGIWDDFMRIRTETRKHNYNIETSQKDFNDTLAEFKENWSRPIQNFAFGAYDNDKMIGFISGTYEVKLAKIMHLYVLPQYQGQHIGKVLLTSAESAISIDADTSDLIAMGNSDKFYEKHGYYSETKTNHYKKSLKNSGHCSVAPSFRCMPTLINKFAKISGKPCESYNRKKINQERTPVFIYRDVNSKVTGFGICGTTTEIHATSDWAKSRIEKAITKYRQEFIEKSK